MNKYEVLYIIDASIDDAAKEAQMAKYSDLITANGGSVESIDKWGIRKFAYPMEFKNEGYYVLMTFTAPADLPAENLEKHHIIYGTGNRKVADRHGLWIYLCHYHHYHNQVVLRCVHLNVAIIGTQSDRF